MDKFAKLSRRLKWFAALIVAIAMGAMLPISAHAADLENFYFRYDFSDGTRQFIGSASQASDPVTVDADAANFVAAYGQDGAATAVHIKSNAYGSNTIGGSSDVGKTVLAGDWTLAMSFRPGNVNKGLLISLGRANETGSKVIFLASSSSPGKLYVGTARRKVKSGTYSDSNTRELAHEWELTTSADLTTGYHTIVASHVAGGTVTVYVDGELAGTVDTTLDCSAATCVFGNGIQFNQAHGTASFLNDVGYSQSLNNPDVAFQDMRFYNSAFTAEDAAAYAALYPATLPGFSNLGAYAYVQSYGVNAVDTGYKATKTTTFKADYQLSADNENQCRIFGARGDFGAAHYVNGSGNFAFNMGSAQSGHWKSLDINQNTDRHWFTLAPASKGFTGTLYAADRSTEDKSLNDGTATSDKTATLNIHLFADKQDASTISGFGRLKLYSFSAETNSIPAAFFAPTTDGNGAAGFTNVVAGTFHGEIMSSPSTALSFASGIGQAEDYRYRSGKFYSRIYATSTDPRMGLVKFDGGEAAGTNAQFTARGRKAKIIAVPAEGCEFDYWIGDTWAIASGYSTISTSIEVKSDTAIHLRAVFRAKPEANALLTVPADGAGNINWSTADWRDIDNPGEQTPYPTERDVTIVAHKSFTLIIDATLSLSNLTVQADANCVVTLATGSGSFEASEVVVRGGVLKQGTANVLGVTPKVTIEDGGTFDFNAKNVDDATWFYLAGAGAGDWPWAVTSTGGAPTNYVHNFVLTTNATIGSSDSSQLKVGQASDPARGTLTLNGHTMTVSGGMWLTFRRLKTPGTGTILHNGRGTAFYESNINTEEGTTTFILGDAMNEGVNVNNPTTVNAFEWRGCTLNTSSAALTVKSSLAGYGTTARLSFADGAAAVLEGDLTVTGAMTAAGALALTRAAGVETNVTVAVTGTLTASGAITVGAGVIFDIGVNRPTETLTVDNAATLALRKAGVDEDDIVVKVSARPQNIVVYNTNGAAVQNPAVAYDPGAGTLTINIPTPVWTNSDGTGSLDSTANWTESVPQPGESFIINLSADTAISVSGDFTPAEMRVTGSGTATFSGSGSIVAGQKVKVASGTSIVASGMLTTPAIDIASESSATISDSASLADGGLTGSGTLIIDLGNSVTNAMSKSNTGFTGSVVVKTGTVKLGNTTSFGPKGTASVRVKGGAAIDQNIENAYEFSGDEIIAAVLEEGATLTTSTDVTGNEKNKTTAITDITLEGDATFDNAGNQMQMGKPSYQAKAYAHIRLGEHTLTLKGSGKHRITATDITGTGTFDLAEGTLSLRSSRFNGRLHPRCENGTVRIRNGATMQLELSDGSYATTFTMNNLRLDGTANRGNANNVFNVTGSITGNGTIDALTLGADAVFKPSGTGYLTVSTALTGTMKVDAAGLSGGIGARVPLFKVGSEEMLPAAEAITLLNASGWKLVRSREGYGYDLVKKGFVVIVI